VVFIWFFSGFVRLLRRYLKYILYTQKPPAQWRHHLSGTQNNAPAAGYKNRKKPEWVVNELIRVKAYQPDLSCRLVAEIFNQKHGDCRIQSETVSKSYVANLFTQNRYQLMQLRRSIKSRPAHNIPFNKIWGMDLTFIEQQPVLGVIEHHSRKVLMLKRLKNKSSTSVLRALLDILESVDKPLFIRTDNEICFNSRLIRFGLWLLGIKKQTTEKHSPWQNGRIERFFGTLKRTLIDLPSGFKSEEELPYLQSFQWWYNNVRLHQNLNFQKPESVYQKATVTAKMKPDKVNKNE